ncbi:hypothetical protein ACFL6P_05995 [Candidatus Latescibacterota bacterium]
MPDPYYPKYPDYVVNPPIIDTPVKYSPSQLLSPQNNYWPSCSDSLEAAIHDTKTYGLDVTDLIMQDKTRIISTTARLLRHQIDARTNLMNDNIGNIDDKIVKCGGYLCQLEALPYFGNKMVEAQRTNLNNEITRLESEKRKEVVSSWGDKVRLYSDLMQSLGEYQNIIRRTQLLSGEE